MFELHRGVHKGALYTCRRLSRACRRRLWAWSSAASNSSSSCQRPSLAPLYVTFSLVYLFCLLIVYLVLFNVLCNISASLMILVKVTYHCCLIFYVQTFLYSINNFLVVYCQSNSFTLYTYHVHIIVNAIFTQTLSIYIYM